MNGSRSSHLSTEIVPKPVNKAGDITGKGASTRPAHGLPAY